MLYFSKPVVRLFLSLEAHPRDRLASLALNRPTFGSRPENRPLYFYLSLEVVSKAFTDFFVYGASFRVPIQSASGIIREIQAHLRLSSRKQASIFLTKLRGGFESIL